MCWNADISINTFMFGAFALVFIYITNTYSKYKTKAFDNPLVYLFMIAVISVQLLEHFLWRNLNNKSWNTFLSKLIAFAISVQIITLILMVNPVSYRYSMLAVFLIVLLTYFYYKATYDPIEFTTTIGKNGHLSWNWMANKYYSGLFSCVALFFYVFPLFFIDNFLLYFMVLFTIAFTILVYKDRTFGTMWCWIANFAFLYFILNILFIQPFYEYNGLC